MNPGIHLNIPDDDYRRIPALSQSAINFVIGGNRSMANLRAYMDGDRVKADTPALAFGRAFDTFLLDIEAFNTAYAVAPPEATDKRCKAWNEFKATLPESVTPISHADYMTIYEMAQAIVTHPEAGPLKNILADHQASIVWEQGGVLCKGRMDRLAVSRKIVVDIKTTESASPDEFAKSIVNYGYHRQAWMYQSGVRAITGEVPAYAIIAVEKSPPHAVTVWEIRDDAEAGMWLSIAEHECMSVIGRYRACVESGVWPSYPTEASVPVMPAWYARQWASMEMTNAE